MVCKGMINLKNIINDRLSKMEDLTQRKMLKDIIASVFNSLVDYQENMNKDIENRIFNEIEYTEKKYDVYLTISHKDKIDPVDEFLYPICEEDIKEKKFDIKEIIDKLKNKEDINLVTIFMNCSYENIKKVINNKNIYEGQIITDKGKYKIKVKLKECRKYNEKIEKLYEIFQKNSIPWKTINNPYSNKFFDIILTECGDISDEEEILEINFNLEEYEKYKMVNIIPLWNIEKIIIKNNEFPVPAVDKVNFEHILSLDKIGKYNGYLVDDKENLIRYIKQGEDSLTIVSPKENAGSWNLLKITNSIKNQNENREYEIISNSRINSFINKFAKNQSYIIRTKAEINRIINSFEILKYVEFEDIEIKENNISKKQTYDMNYFIVDEIRVGDKKKTMILKFKEKERNNIFSYDYISFLVSEIQMYFPDYKCEGEII